MSENFLPVLTYTFGATKIDVCTRDITGLASDKVAEEIKMLRVGISSFNDFPMKEGETWGAYSLRLVQERPVSARKKNESDDEYITRMFKPPLTTMKRGYDIVKIFCSIFKTSKGEVQTAPSEAEFNASAWLEVRCFLYDILNLCELDEEAEGFLPKGSNSGFIEQEEQSRPTKKVIGAKK